LASLLRTSFGQPASDIVLPACFAHRFASLLRTSFCNSLLRTSFWHAATIVFARLRQQCAALLPTRNQKETKRIKTKQKQNLVIEQRDQKSKSIRRFSKKTQKTNPKSESESEIESKQITTTMPVPDQVFIPSEFSPNTLKFSAPRAQGDRGMKTIFINAASRGSVGLELPWMLTWNGIKDFTDLNTGISDGKFSIELAFPLSNDTSEETETLLTKLQQLDDHIVAEATKCSELWFGKVQSREVVKEFFTSPLKAAKKKPAAPGRPAGEEYPPSLKIKVPCYKEKEAAQEKWPIMVFDNEGLELFPRSCADPTLLIRPRSKVACVIKIKSIWIVNKSWGYQMELCQMATEPRVEQLENANRSLFRNLKPSLTPVPAATPAATPTPAPAAQVATTYAADSDDEQVQEEVQEEEQEQQDMEVVATPVPVPVATPTPAPTPAPVVVEKKVVKRPAESIAVPIPFVEPAAAAATTNPVAAAAAADVPSQPKKKIVKKTAVAAS